MMREARAELEQARASDCDGQATGDGSEFDAHDLVLALLEGDYARRRALLGTEPRRS